MRTTTRTTISSAPSMRASSIAMQATLTSKTEPYTTEIPTSIIYTSFAVATTTSVSSSMSTIIYPTSQMSTTTSEFTMITTPFFQTTSTVLSTTTIITLFETTSKSFISIFTITMTQSIPSKTDTTTSHNIIPTTISETPTKTIQQTFYSVITAPTLLMTITKLMGAKEKTFSKTTVETINITESILFIMTSRKILTVMSNSTLSLVTTQKSLVSLFTSTKTSDESHNILLYVLYSLLFVITSITIISFIACYHYYARKQQQLFDEYSITVLNTPMFTNTYSSTNNDKIRSKNLSSISNTFSSLLSRQFSETQSLEKVNKRVGHIVDDNGF
ncbi:unnamed protein product [Rotaria sp. Silwood2]|nr:unnamed protein product [Rotaria sp. Silwood2]